MINLSGVIVFSEQSKSLHSSGTILLKVEIPKPNIYIYMDIENPVENKKNMQKVLSVSIYYL